MDVLPSGNLFRELQDVTDTGYFEWKLSLEDYWQQTYTMRIISIRGDGNCLFRSIAYCVYHNQERHREIRMKVIDTVVKNWYRYKDFIIGDRSYGSGIETAEDYYRLMARDGEYAGHVELHSASEIFRDYTFKVHRNGCNRTIDYGHGPVEKHLLFSGYFDAGHYSVLEF